MCIPMLVSTIKMSLHIEICVIAQYLQVLHPCDSKSRASNRVNVVSTLQQLIIRLLHYENKIPLVRPPSYRRLSSIAYVSCEHSQQALQGIHRDRLPRQHRNQQKLIELIKLLSRAPLNDILITSSGANSIAIGITNL